MLNEWEDQDGPYSGTSSLHRQVSKPQCKEQDSGKEFLGCSRWVLALGAGDTIATETGNVTVLQSLPSWGETVSI